MPKSETFLVTVDDNDNYNVIDQIELDKYRADKAQVDPVTGSKQTPSKHYLVGENLVEPKYNPHDLVQLLDLYTYHEACVDAVATDASGINYTLDTIEGIEPVEAQKDKFKQVLEASKPSINIHLKRCAYDRRSIGYGAIEVIRKNTSNSEIRRFKHIPSHTLRRHTDEKRVLHTADDGTRVWYVIYGKNYNEDGELCDVHADTGIFYPYNSLPEDKRANELLWTMEYAPGTNYYGRPVVIAALPSIKGDMSAVAYNVSFFENNGMPRFAVTVTGDFEDYNVDKTITDDDGTVRDNPEYDETKTLRYQISQQIKQLIKHPHSALCITIPTLGGDSNVEIKITPLQVQTEEGHFRMYRKDIRDEVIHGHKVDPSRLAIFDAGSLNGTNSDNTRESYKYGTVAPIKSELEAMVNQTKEELGVNSWEFKIVDVNPIDYSKDKELAAFLFSCAAMTPMDLINTFGEKFGLTVDDPDDPYLNSYYLNNVPLEKVWNNNESNPYLEVDSILGDLEDNLRGESDDLTDPIEDSEETDISSEN